MVCGGVQVHVTDPARVDAIRGSAPRCWSPRGRYDAFDWRGRGDTAGADWIDLLTGSEPVPHPDRRRAPRAAEIMAAWQRELAEFDRRRRPYLLYRGGR